MYMCIYLNPPQASENSPERVSSSESRGSAEFAPHAWIGHENLVSRRAGDRSSLGSGRSPAAAAGGGRPAPLSLSHTLSHSHSHSRLPVHLRNLSLSLSPFLSLSLPLSRSHSRLPVHPSSLTGVRDFLVGGLLVLGDASLR
jgi:hypothetical protein